MKTRINSLSFIARAICVCVLIGAIAGCTGMGVQGLSADQIKASANVKDVNALCFTTIGPWGSVITNYLSIDQKVLPKDGKIGLTKECQIDVTTSSPPPRVIVQPAAAP